MICLRIKYALSNMSLRQQALCFGDLMRYYGDSKFKLAETVAKIANNKGLRVKLLNAIRKHTGSSGLTVESLITGLETASSIDIFNFKVNGVNPCEIFGDKNVELEIYMNPLYFTTRGAITQHLPGLHKARGGTEKMMLIQAKKEEANWVRWFEKELDRYHHSNHWAKKVVEE